MAMSVKTNDKKETSLSTTKTANTDRYIILKEQGYIILKMYL